MKYYSVDTRLNPPEIKEVNVSRETKDSVMVRKERGLSKRIQEYNGYTIAYFNTYAKAKKFWLSCLYKEKFEAERLVRIAEYELKKVKESL